MAEHTAREKKKTERVKGHVRTLQNRRRLDRHYDEILRVLHELPSPAGAVLAEHLVAIEAAFQPAPCIDWDSLPSTCDPIKNLKVRPEHEGSEAEGARMASRAARKRLQVESFALVLRELLAADPRRSWRCVDFGCGSGQLLLPLAATFRACTFTGVEMRPPAAELLRQHAVAAGLTNVRVFVGMVEHFEEPFDVALALHACGNATDHSMLKATRQRAAYIVSPCCVGKLKFSLAGGTSLGPERAADAANWSEYWKQRGSRRKDGSTIGGGGGGGGSGSSLRAAGGTVGDEAAAAAVERTSGGGPEITEAGQGDDVDSGSAAGSARAQEVPALPSCAEDARVQRLQHPRSRWFRHRLPDPDRHFRLMAKAADSCHSPAQAAELTDAKMAGKASVASVCKAHVELDRSLAAVEDGYVAGVFKVLRAAVMAKNDLLVGVPEERLEWQHVQPMIAAAGLVVAAAEGYTAS